jgi:hypothetical protein
MGGRHRSQLPGHCGPLLAGCYRRSELHRGSCCMARLAGHRPAALPGLSARRLLAKGARGSETHFGAEDKQTRIRLSQDPIHQKLEHSPSAFTSPPPDPQPGNCGWMKRPGPTQESTCPRMALTLLGPPVCPPSLQA